MIACSSCEWMGYEGDCKPVPVPRLQAGETYVAPYGACPQCGLVVPASTPVSNREHFARHWRDGAPERGNLTALQRDCLLVALAQITPEHPGFNGSPEVAQLLGGSPLVHYIGSWVRPLLECALYGPAYYDQGGYVAQDAAVVRVALRP